MPYHTTSPHRLIPLPIKRSRILVSGGVVIVISVKLYVIKSVGCDVCGGVIKTIDSIINRTLFLVAKWSPWREIVKESNITSVPV